MRRHLSRRVRARTRRRHLSWLSERRLSGKWADAHQGFPWYGIGWGWHVFLIWPALGYLVTAPIRAFSYARMAQREPAG